METITRDTYAEGTRFKGSEIFEIAIGIGSALEHLHARGMPPRGRSQDLGNACC